MRSLVFIASLLLSGLAFGQDTLRPNLQISVDAASGQIRRLDAVRVDASEILKGLFRASGRRGQVGYDVDEEITVSLRDVRLEVGIEEIAQLAHARVSYTAGVFDIEPLRGLIATFDADSEDARDAIHRLMRLGRHPYSIAPGIQGPVILHVRDADFETALRTILDQVDATYRIEAGVYQVVSRGRMNGYRYWNMDAREALVSIFNRLGVSYSIDPSLSGNVESSVLDLEPSAALARILSQLQATARVGHDFYYVYPTPREQPNEALYVVTPPPPRFVDESESSKLIVPSSDLNEVDARDAIRLLMKWANYSYSIAPEVQGTVTVNLKNVRFKTALENVLKQVDATYRIRNGVYEIYRIERPPSGSRD